MALRSKEGKVAAPITISPLERLYTVEELISVHLTVPLYDRDGNFRYWKRLFGRSQPAQHRFVQNYLSETREPGKIWARRIGGMWLIPERSFFDFMRGDCADEQCPQCGGRLSSLLQGDGDLLLRIKSRLQTAETAEFRAQQKQEKERREQELLDRELEQLADPNNPTFKVFEPAVEDGLTEQGNELGF